MAVDTYVYQVIEEQMNLVLALDDTNITDSAKKIAFYSAMLDAAPEDPLDDAEEQEELMKYFRDNLATELLTYMELVNERM